MDIFLVRHGETDWNIDHRLQSYTEVPLNNKGMIQTQKLASYLHKYKIHVILTSPMKRTVATAQAIAKLQTGIKIIKEPHLKEINFGIQEGQTVASKYPTHIISNEQKYNYVHPGGESMANRVNELTHKVKEWEIKYVNQTILLSTHGYITKAILIALQLYTFEELIDVKFVNSALTHIRINKERSVILFNYNEFL